ncbi:MAG TPA: glycosyltransferase family 4 protein [Burkholderiales bacterium]|nr:glycosyltransferase family 4 protein [Burkholderiales bacterium]
MSDSPDTPSGFGNVTHFVCEGLARRGHRVGILGWQTRNPFEWNGCKVYPTHLDPLGSDALYGYLVRHRPDAVIALADVWWLPFFTAPHVRRQMELTDTPWLLYFPVDGDTQEERLPPSWIELLREVDVPIAMSRYGQRVAERCGIRCEYIPHGVDLDIFSPPPDREQAKARLGAQGKFLVLSDSRNQPRKLLPRLLDVFARFAAQRPDALLHLHTDPDDEFSKSPYYSYDLRADVRHLGLDTRVRFTPGFTMKQGTGLPLSELAACYQAADVHLLASSGEGFGLPTLQAAAAGAVPLASAYSASLELVEGHGQAIAVSEWSETEFGIRRALIDVKDASDKLAHYYEDRALLREHSAKARQFALAYGWEAVVDQWDRLLCNLGSGRRRIVRPPYRTVQRVQVVDPAMSGVPSRTPSPYLTSVSVDNRVQRELPAIPGASVTVTMVQREVGRLEASIVADAKRQDTEVRIPVVPQACELGRLRVPRRPGYVCVAPGDVPIFTALQRIFPMLRGWMPVRPGQPQAPKSDRLLSVAAADAQDVRYELAQSTIVLNVAGSLVEQMLVDAALYGVLCIGTPRASVQTMLWDELATDDEERAVCLARALFTNAARVKRLAALARDDCRRVYAPSEEQSAACLRRLHAAQWAERSSVAAAAGG